MAILTNFDKIEFSGKLGDKVGVRGKYGHYMRSLGKKSTKPPTDLQLATRMRFALISSFLNPLRNLLELVYESRKNKKMSAYNLAVSDNIKIAVEGEYPGLFIDYAKLRLSRGPFPRPLDVRMLQEEDGMLLVSWRRANDSLCNIPVVVLYYQESGYYQVKWVQSGLDDLQVRFRPENAEGQTIHAWLFFASERSRGASDTQYAGNVRYTF